MKTWFTSDTHFGHFNVINYSNRPFLAKQEGDEIVAGDKRIPVDNTKPIEAQIQRASVEWMNQTLIDNWNAKIASEDLVYFVGDFAFLNLEQMKTILDQLHGRKILIKGNHDRSAKQMLSIGFAEVHNELTIKILDEEVLMSHYPYVDSSLHEVAKKRPNVIQFIDHPSLKLVTKPEGLSYHETQQWLAKYIKIPVNTNQEGSKEHVIMLQRLISQFIGTRPLNEGKVLLHGHSHSGQRRKNNMINFSVEAWDYGPASLEEVENLIKDFKKEVTGDSLTLENCDSELYQYYLELSKNLSNDMVWKNLGDKIQTYQQAKYCMSKGEKFKTYNVPRNYSKTWYEANLQFQGFIPKDKLEHGKFYKGSCRNARWAYWDKSKEEFFYIRSKFGSNFVESINPLENDNGFDLFIPHEEYEPSDEEMAEFWTLHT